MGNFSNSFWQKLLDIPKQDLVIIAFGITLVVELLFSYIRHLKLYQTRDTLVNLCIGFVSFIFDFMFSIVSFPILMYLFHPENMWSGNGNHLQQFIILFLAVDFIEYWFHRWSHTVNILWSAHLVHHQSEFYNLSVGLRSSFIVPIFNILFYLPLPLLGFNPNDILTVIFIQGIYQLFLHTNLVGGLGILDKIFITPSIHRVHHGSNEIYLDKNYGKVFLIWDYLFATYEAESETVIFGLTSPPENQKYLAYIIKPYQELRNNFKESHGIKDRFEIIFGKPKNHSNRA